MENAKEKLIELTENTIFIGHYEDEKTKEWEKNSQLAYAKEQGSLETKFETARKMKEKNTGISFISEMTCLSIEDIQKL